MMSNPLALVLSQIHAKTRALPRCDSGVVTAIETIKPAAATQLSWRALQQQADTDSPIESVCVDKIWQTANVVTLVFQAKQPRPFMFKPGQFVTIKVMINGQAYYRSYSISSSPSRPLTLALTIKKVPNGKVSSYLVDAFNCGDSLTLQPAAGEFNLIDIAADKYLFISAGCGITPMMSMLTFLADSDPHADIAFVHCASTAADIIFRQELQQWQCASRNRQLSYFITHGDGQLGDQFGTHWAQGRLDIARLQHSIPDYKQRTVFVCGPGGFIQSLQDELANSGFEMERFHQESFEATPRASMVSSHDTVSLTCGEHQHVLAKGATLLDGVEALGLPVISPCRSGVCGSCKCQLVSGQVTKHKLTHLTHQEIEAGVVLACSTTLNSDVVIAAL
ncbi:flavin reductase family protein [Shewanella sp. NIFS-20-20]|uniref:flavin reductase family protein n=1 Tax=Shewanella sp. NIFS-20-20 TaxID=2853806 RepID=UPI001C46577A|nr:iron-sulfur cluster-binding domain-containing protein [Shewanella sp. NIFS-20-20]MBV7314212.1 iron-sulfur cluster-binding domain-containing protein [Shewanella sp. NIFS-20-20]